MSNASELGQTRIELWDAQKEIERLRKRIKFIYESSKGDIYAENERLRREVDEREKLIVENACQKEEIERLREALETDRKWINKRDDEIERLRDELEKANNEFGSMTADWPGLWERIAEIKKTSNDRWQKIEWLRGDVKAAFEECWERGCEIDRLRAERDEYKQTTLNNLEGYKQEKAKGERLRAALERIANNMASCDGKHMKQIAKEALQ